MANSTSNNHQSQGGKNGSDKKNTKPGAGGNSQKTGQGKTARDSSTKEED